VMACSSVNSVVAVKLLVGDANANVMEKNE